MTGHRLPFVLGFSAGLLLCLSAGVRLTEAPAVGPWMAPVGVSDTDGWWRQPVEREARNDRLAPQSRRYHWAALNPLVGPSIERGYRSLG